MIYRALRSTLLWALRARLTPPQPPPGEPESAELFRASPRYLAQSIILHLASALPLVAIEGLGWLWSPSSTWLSRRISLIVLVATLALTALRYFLLRLEYEMRFYLLTDRCLRIRRGVLLIEESTYTLENIQTVALRQGPIDRLFGIASVHIETAGGGTAEASPQAQPGMFHRGRIDGITAKKAHELQAWFATRLSEYHDSGLGEPQAAAQPIANGSLQANAIPCLTAIRDELRALNQ